MSLQELKERQRAMLAASTDQHQPWYRIRNVAGDNGTPAEISIYGEIGYWEQTAADFMAELKTVTAPAINLRINSGGGEIFEGMAIASLLRSHDAYVTVIVDGLAASIASVIAMAGNKVIMSPFSQMMIHDGSGMCIGNADEMREMADLLDRQSDNIAAVYNAKAGGGMKTWRARMRDETWYTDQEAVAAGLADEVAKAATKKAPAMDPKMDPAMAEFDLSTFRYPGRSAAPAPDLGDVATPGVDAAASPSPKNVSASAPNPPDAELAGPDPEPLPPAAAEPAEVDAEVLVSMADMFRAAVGAAAEDPFEFDPEGFAGTLASLTAAAAGVSEAEQSLPIDVDDEEEDEPDDEDDEEDHGQIAAGILTTLATQAAAVAPRAPEPEPEPVVTEAPPAPEPPPDPWATVAEVFAAAIALEAGHMPSPATTPEPEPEPDHYDPVLAKRALKEAAA